LLAKENYVGLVVRSTESTARHPEVSWHIYLSIAIGSEFNLRILIEIRIEELDSSI
jgi:hypothetical protein